MTTAQEIIDNINYVLEDPALQRNIKSKLDQIVQILKTVTKQDIRLKAGKCTDLLSDVCEDVNIQSFVRTQLFQISGMLESLEF
jgi:uncharacterized protein (UPF0147 family)